MLKVTALLFLSLLFAAIPISVWAQDGSSENSTPTVELTTTPQGLHKGVVTGKIINKNDPSGPVGDLEVSLHVLDKDQNQVGMLHGKSVQDGSFTIADVPFQMGMGYRAAVTYKGTTYYSQVVPAEEGKTNVNLLVPVFERTTDLKKVQVEQMHVLIDFSQDGVDVKEIYVISNLGDRTVKDAVEVPENNGTKAAVRFSLPEKADYINFQPQSESRFLKFRGGFADTASLVPGQMTSQFIVSYLLPYTTPLTYQLKTVLPVLGLNFMLPKDSGVTLKGTGLGAPQPVTAQNGQIFYLYKLENIPAGQILDLTLEGKPVIHVSQTAEAASPTKTSSNRVLLLGLGVFGAVLIGGGAFWWVRSSKKSVGDDNESKGLNGEIDEGDQPEFEALLEQIGQLDRVFEQGEVDADTYNAQRSLLKNRAKAMLVELEVKTMERETVPTE